VTAHVHGRLPAPHLPPAAGLVLRAAAGRWYQETIGPVPVSQRHRIQPWPVSVYLVTGRDGRIEWLGKADRDPGVAARLDDHLRHPDRRATFYQVRAVLLRPDTPPAAVLALEGKLADVLSLRGWPGRAWPSAAMWPELVA